MKDLKIKEGQRPGRGGKAGSGDFPFLASESEISQDPAAKPQILSDAQRRTLAQSTAPERQSHLLAVSTTTSIEGQSRHDHPMCVSLSWLPHRSLLRSPTTFFPPLVCQLNERISTAVSYTRCYNVPPCHAHNFALMHHKSNYVLIQFYVTLHFSCTTKAASRAFPAGERRNVERSSEIDPGEAGLFSLRVVESSEERVFLLRRTYPFKIHEV